MRAPEAYPPLSVAIVGAGPAGLMAAQALSAKGLAVSVYERMPTAGRKLLMAGRGGLNLTHSEPFERFKTRYGDARGRLAPLLDAFPPQALIAWAQDLGQETFVGSSGRVFPKALKASPLLRAWLARLAAQGVNLQTRREWLGWDEGGGLRFGDAEGEIATVRADATVLALGGASWPGLGSNGAWAPVLTAKGLAVTPFRPSNGGFDVAWSEAFRERFAGAPLKNIALRFGGQTARGEMAVTGYGLEGGAIYALSALLREAITAQGSATIAVDLRPDMPLAEMAVRLGRPAAGQSLSNILRKALNLSPGAINLLREAHGRELPSQPQAMAAAVKAAPLRLTGVQPLARAISTAGGLAFSELDETLMLRARPGVFAAGEMLDWEAPTGGYLLQAALATGLAAAQGVLGFLQTAS